MSFSSEGLRKCDARLLGELPPLLLVHLDLEKLRIIMVLKTEREYSSSLESTKSCWKAVKGILREPYKESPPLTK